MLKVITYNYYIEKVYFVIISCYNSLNYCSSTIKENIKYETIFDLYNLPSSITLCKRVRRVGCFMCIRSAVIYDMMG